jgi:uncharacterized protein (DUF1697 family)
MSMSRDIHIALLRGINVGGKHRLPMKDLAGIFREAGCTDVRTFIQSGNVVFRVEDGLAQRVASRVADTISGRFGFDAPVVTRTAAELEVVAGHNPFLEDGADPKRLHVVFLADQPGEAQIAELDPDRSPPDEFVVRGREIYLHCPNGAGRSKLTAPYFDKTLETVSTQRNWRTVGKLLELATGG